MKTFAKIGRVALAVSLISALAVPEVLGQGRGRPGGTSGSPSANVRSSHVQQSSGRRNFAPSRRGALQSTSPAPAGATSLGTVQRGGVSPSTSLQRRSLQSQSGPSSVTNRSSGALRSGYSNSLRAESLRARGRQSAFDRITPPRRLSSDTGSRLPIRGSQLTLPNSASLRESYSPRTRGGWHTGVTRPPTVDTPSYLRRFTSSDLRRSSSAPPARGRLTPSAPDDTTPAQTSLRTPETDARSGNGVKLPGSTTTAAQLRRFWRPGDSQSSQQLSVEPLRESGRNRRSFDRPHVGTEATLGNDSSTGAQPAERPQSHRPRPRGPLVSAEDQAEHEPSGGDPSAEPPARNGRDGQRANNSDGRNRRGGHARDANLRNRGLLDTSRHSIDVRRQTAATHVRHELRERSRHWKHDHDIPFCTAWWTHHGHKQRRLAFHIYLRHHHHQHPYYWWHCPTAPRLTTWLSFRWPRPYYWDYGPGGYIYCANNVIYVNGRWFAPAPLYHQRTVLLAQSAPQINPALAADIDWLPLGVFALMPEGSPESELLLQIAITSDGVLGGTVFNQATGESFPLEGIVDSRTQRAVWTYADARNRRVTMETGIYNFTKPETTLLAHFGPDQIEVWQMLRLEQPADGPIQVPPVLPERSGTLPALPAPAVTVAPDGS